jgi:hypothetical protein
MTPQPFDYNSTRSKLLLSEYGRNVQNMVKYIVALPTKEERNRYAAVVIDLMGFLNPHLRDVADFKHKLWDHLHIIYPHQRIKYKHYGKTIELMIVKAKSITEPERRNHMVHAIANFMKMAYVQWNKDSVADETIFNHLFELSGGELKLDESINLNKVEYRTNTHKTENTNRGRTNNQNNNNRGGGSGGRTNNNPRQNNNQNNRGRNAGSGGGGGRKY